MPKFSTLPQATLADITDNDIIPFTDSDIITAKTITFALLKTYLKAWYDTIVSTFTNKTINLTSNTLLGTKTQFNTANTDGDFMFLDSVDTVSGTKTFLSGNLITTKPVINGTDPTGSTYTPATGAQVVTIDCASNNMHIVTGHASGTAITFAITNATNNQPFIVSILQGAVVSIITGWFSTVRWAGGSVPILTATVGKRDTFGFIRTGLNTYDGFIIGQNN